ncbi:hypothetical protein [Mesorhizobium sp. M0522]|uniref:hypothetical protein n=1 Tax=Mesorhizobium sp. M0522 TaxID=2956958 RepID=UPI0033365EC1
MKPMAYDISDLSLNTLIGPVCRATEVLARLDERLALTTIFWPKNLPRSMLSWHARQRSSAAPTCLLEERRRHFVTGRSRKTA